MTTVEDFVRYESINILGRSYRTRQKYQEYVKNLDLEELGKEVIDCKLFSESYVKTKIKANSKDDIQAFRDGLLWRFDRMNGVLFKFDEISILRKAGFYKN